MTQKDYDELRAKIRMDLAQEYNWDKQQAHWETVQDHYTAQERHWKWLILVGTIAVTVNGLAAFFAK